MFRLDHLKEITCAALAMALEKLDDGNRRIRSVVVEYLGTVGTASGNGGFSGHGPPP